MEKLLIFCIIGNIFYLCIEDIRTKEVPNLGNLFLLCCSLIYSRINGNYWDTILISISLYSFPLIFLYGYVSDFVQKEVLGFGDIKFVMSVGAIMASTYHLWISIYYFYMISFVLASMIGVYILYSKKTKELAMLPYFSLSLCILKVYL